MFLKAHIWKLGLGRLLVAGLAFISLGLASSAYAASESYVWTSAANTAVTASGGAFAQPATLTLVGSVKPDGSADFAGPVTVTCSTTTATATLTLNIDKSNYKQIYPSLATINAPPELTCANLDSPTTVASDSGATTSGTVNTTASAQAQCDQGSLSWIMCPAIDNLSGQISKMGKNILVPLLQVNQISPTTTPEIYQVWQAIRNFTDVLFILVFFVVIFATAFQQDIGPFDQYSLRKIWPRLVFAAVLIQFSFYFCGFLVDIGNVLGAGVETLMTSVIPAAHGAATLGNLVSNLLVGGVALLAGAGAILVLASWTAAVPLLISLMLSLLAVFLTLGARYIVIGLLIIASPLAILAWVLPNTRKYSSDWLKTFVRLIMMYPLIVAILSVAGMVNELLPFGHDAAATAAAGVAVSIVTPLITVAAFLMIPFTFKIAGRGVDQLYGFITGTSNRGKGILKGSDMWEKGADQRKRNQAGLMNRVIKSNAVTSLQGKGAAGRGAAGLITFGAGTALLNAPKTRQSVDKLRSQTAATAFKQISELDEASIPMLQKVADLTSSDATKRTAARRLLQTEAPNLLRIASTPAGRAAVVKTLADKGMLSSNDVQGVLTAPRGSFASSSANVAVEFPDLLKAGGKEFGAKPTVLARFAKPEVQYELKTDLGGRKYGDKITRDIGDLDVNLVGGLIRNVSASAFGDKHSVENFKLMSKRDDSNPQTAKAAAEIAELYARNLGTSVVERAFSPHNKDYATRAVRGDWIKAVANQDNLDTFIRLKPEIIENMVAHLNIDQDTVSDILEASTISKYVYDRPGISQTEREHLARDWMRGQYDPSHDYLTGGASTPLA